MLLGLAIACLLCAVIPCLLFSWNLALYREPPPASPGELPAVSILIPARNEALAIGDALAAALQTREIVYEIIVMDDNSTDATASIVLAQAAIHPNVRLERAPALPPGWNGKQHACWSLAHAARNPILCFVDADVRLAPECIARMAQFLRTSDSALVSGFPRQVTVTFLEWLLLPLIHFVLLGFLPIARMRLGTDASLAAGCGQFMMARRDDYFATGGHSGIKLTMHDGLRLPRLFRAHGRRTDLADITNFATCRMYTTGHQVWSGLAKNATEGIAAPGRIVPISIILMLGQIFPFFLAAIGVVTLAGALTSNATIGPDAHLTQSIHFWSWLLISALSVLCAWLPRILAVRRFRQDWRSAALHPIGILLLLVLQWYALIRKLRGASTSWRDRTYTPAA